ncbi:MAG: hypothetical protein ACRCSR_06580 [Bacteroidales bacterium]
MKKLSLFFILISLSFSLFSKSFGRGKAGGHEADAYSVMPFSRSDVVSDWFEVIHKTIDFPYNTYFPGLRDAPHQNFSWGKYGHRLFFHWGFNTQPWSPQLEEQAGKCGWSEQTLQSFKEKIRTEQARRNRQVMERTASTLGFGMSGRERDYSNAFASIVYNSHLLGDYSTTKTAMLQDVNSIITDIQTALFNKLQGGEKAKVLNGKLERIKRGDADVVTKANEALRLLQSDLPGLILSIQDGYFKNHFAKRGLQLR